MTMTPIDPEPSMPPNAEWVGDWAEDVSGVFRYYREADIYPGVYVFGYQNFDGSERGRSVYLRGDRELTGEQNRALALVLLDADRV